MNTPSSGTATPPDLEQGEKAYIQKRLTLTFQNLNVRVTAPDAALGSTILSEADPRQILDFFRRNQRPKRVCGDMCRMMVVVDHADKYQAILTNVTGQVKPGETV